VEGENYEGGDYHLPYFQQGGKENATRRTARLKSTRILNTHVPFTNFRKNPWEIIKNW